MENGVGMLACWHVGTLGVYKYKAWMGKGVGMSACWQVGTLGVYKCKTWMGEGVGMYTYLNHVLCFSLNATVP